MNNWDTNNMQVYGGTSISGRPWVYVSLRNKGAWAPQAEFAVPAAEAVRTLARKGVTIIGSEKAELIRRVENLDDYPTMPLLERVGWNGDYFALPNGQVFAPAAAPAGEVIFDLNADKCTSAGNLDDWLATVAEPVAGQTLWEFALCQPFAAPLLHVIGRRENAIVEWQGPKGVGKSTLQMGQASTTGRALGGGKERYWVPLRSTTNGLELEMEYYSDGILVGEELSLFAAGDSKKVRADKIDGLLWMLSRGAGKIRFGSNTPEESRLLGSFSSNGGFIIDIADQSPERADALMDRLLTIPIDGYRPYGVFDFLPAGFKGSVQFAASIEDGLTTNYGVAMPEYLQRLVQLRHNDQEAFVARLRGHIEEFCDRVGVGPNDGSASRVAQLFGLIGAAGRLANHLGVLPSRFRPMESAEACYHLYRAGIRQRLSIADRLASIAADAGTINLDDGLPTLSDDELDEVSAFRKTAADGPQLWLTRPQHRRHFPDWKRVWKSAEMDAVLIAQQGRKGNAGHIRTGSKLQRLYRFRLTA